MTAEMKTPPSLNDRWWTSAHVMIYLHSPSVTAARRWMQRKGVRLCKNDRRLTCQAWIDECLDGKGQKTFFSSTKPKTQAA